MADSLALSQGGMHKSLKGTGVSKATDHTSPWALPVAEQLCTTRNTTQQKKSHVLWLDRGRIIHLETSEFSVEAEQDSSTVCGSSWVTPPHGRD